MTGEDYAHNPSTLLHIAGDLRSRGIPPLEIFRQAGISPSALLDADGWVPRDLCFALGDAAGAVVGDPYFASRIGRSYRLEEFGIWGRTIGGAANVSEACNVAINGLGLLHQGSVLQRIDGEEHTELRFGYHGRMGANPHQHIIGTLAVLRKIALLAGAPEAVDVHFQIPYARGSDCLEETHGSQLEFGCDHNAIVIDNAILDLPLAGGEGRVGGELEPAETAQAVGASVRRLLPYGRANIQTIAAMQRVSTRSVQRRLREWGFSFEEILDDVRRTEAIKLILSGDHSLADVAFLLGYSDQAHFTRAFRRWTGIPPREFAIAQTPTRA